MPAQPERALVTPLLNPGASKGWLAWLTLIVGSQLERSLGVNPFCEPVRPSSATPALSTFAATRGPSSREGLIVIRNMRPPSIAKLTVAIGAVALSSLAGETIEGAFGKKLGDVFDPSSSIRTERVAEGTPEGAPIYEFSPTTRFGSFERYFARITPDTHKIWSLEAVRDVEDKEAAQREQGAIMQQLMEKYGIEREIRTDNGMGEMRRFGQGRRYIETQLTGFIHVTLSVRCGDVDLRRTAFAEKDAAAVELSRSRGDSFSARLLAIIGGETNALATLSTNNTGIRDAETETLLWIRTYFRHNGITNSPGDLRVGMRVEDIVAMLGEPTGRYQIQNGEIIRGKPEGQDADWLSWYHNERGMHVAPFVSVKIEGGVVKALKAGRG